MNDTPIGPPSYPGPRTGERIVLDDETVRRLFAEGGWPCDRINEDTWKSQFRGRSAAFPFYVRVDDAHQCVTFAIVPFLRSPDDLTQADLLYKRLLELNHRLLMAKFSIDDDLDIVLSVEYPLDDLDRSEFNDALDVLSYYAEHYFEELEELA